MRAVKNNLPAPSGGAGSAVCGGACPVASPFLLARRLGEGREERVVRMTSMLPERARSECARSMGAVEVLLATPVLFMFRALTIDY